MFQVPESGGSWSGLLGPAPAFRSGEQIDSFGDEMSMSDSLKSD